MTLRLLAAAKDVERFVYLSSALVYENSNRFPLSESLTKEIPPPTSSYGLAKFFGEGALLLAAKQFGTPYTIWRLFNVVSPLEPHDTPGGHVFVDFYRKLLVERVPTFDMKGSGRQVRCFLWVQDAVDCIVAHLESTSTRNDIFNLASDEPKSLLDLKDELLALGREFGIVDRSYEPTLTTGGHFDGVESEARVPSVEKLRRLVGWTHRTGFDACFRNFVQAKRSS
jgi:nucleoside-diphosphate-sugar epimerase